MVDIPKSNLKDVEKKWTSYLKKQKGKLSDDDDVYFLDNAKIRSISKDTIDIYSTVKSNGDVITVTMALNSGGMFLSNSSGTASAVDRFLYDFAISMKKDILNEELSVAKKLLGTQGKAYDKIEKSNKKLESSIDKMKNQIADNEREIKKNNDKLAKNKSEIAAQKDVVKELENKLKNIE